jgi:hypothetical protein
MLWLDRHPVGRTLSVVVLEPLDDLSRPVVAEFLAVDEPASDIGGRGRPLLSF